MFYGTVRGTKAVLKRDKIVVLVTVKYHFKHLSWYIFF